MSYEGDIEKMHFHEILVKNEPQTNFNKWKECGMKNSVCDTKIRCRQRTEKFASVSYSLIVVTVIIIIAHSIINCTSRNLFYCLFCLICDSWNFMSEYNIEIIIYKTKQQKGYSCDNRGCEICIQIVGWCETTC